MSGGWLSLEPIALCFGRRKTRPMDGWLSLARTHVMPALQAGWAYLLAIPLLVKIGLALAIVALWALRLWLADLRLRALMRQYRSRPGGLNIVAIGVVAALAVGAVVIWRFAHT